MNLSSAPDSRGLNLAGGGLAGSFTCGVGVGLEEMLPGGLHGTFSEITGVSSGAMCLLYAISYPKTFGQVAHDICHTELSGDHLVDWNNFFTNQPIFAVDAFIDEVCFKKYPLDYTKIKESVLNFSFPLYQPYKGSLRWVDRDLLRETAQEEFPRILKAAMAVPFVDNTLTSVLGEKYMDGGMRGVGNLECVRRHNKTIVVLAGNSIGSWREVVGYPFIVGIQMILAVFLRHYALPKKALFDLAMRGWRNRTFMKHLMILEKKGQVLVIQPSGKIGGRVESGQAQIRENYSQGLRTVEKKKHEIEQFLAGAKV